jgi:hypothetical protein
MATPFKSPLTQADFESQHTDQKKCLDDVIFNYLPITADPGRLPKEDFARNFDSSDDSIACMTDDDLINAYKLAGGNRFENQNTMDLNTGRLGSAEDQSIYDPPRLAQCLAPPKRFFRSLWISMAKRLLDEDLSMPDK